MEQKLSFLEFFQLTGQKIDDLERDYKHLFDEPIEVEFSEVREPKYEIY